MSRRRGVTADNHVMKKAKYRAVLQQDVGNLEGISHARSSILNLGRFRFPKLERDLKCANLWNVHIAGHAKCRVSVNRNLSSNV